MTFQPLPDDYKALRAVLEEKLKQGSDKMQEHSVAIEELKEANKTQDERLARIEENTSTLVDIFKAGDGTIKTAKWFGKLLVWIGSLSSSIYAMYYAIINWPHRGA